MKTFNKRWMISTSILNLHVVNNNNIIKKTWISQKLIEWMKKVTYKKHHKIKILLVTNLICMLKAINISLKLSHSEYHSRLSFNILVVLYSILFFTFFLSKNILFLINLSNLIHLAGKAGKPNNASNFNRNIKFWKNAHYQ